MRMTNDPEDWLLTSRERGNPATILDARHAGLAWPGLGSRSGITAKVELVIAPSKSDRERVIPMSAELFSVIAAIIRRHTQNGQAVPLLSRYDPHERRASPAMPFMFQRKIGTNLEVISPATVVDMLRRRCEELAGRHPGFRTACFTPHDFRRLFATDLVNNGLPIHIGAALLGHLNLQTTRGYVNYRELHQPGEKPQVSRSQDCRNSIPAVLMPAL